MIKIRIKVYKKIARDSLDFLKSFIGKFNQRDCNFYDVIKIGYSRPSEIDDSFK